jgi:hypothetical protein
MVFRVSPPLPLAEVPQSGNTPNRERNHTNNPALEGPVALKSMLNGADPLRAAMAGVTLFYIIDGFQTLSNQESLSGHGF